MHLLVSHRDARRGAPRSRAEALERARSLIRAVDAGQPLGRLAAQCSDEPYGRWRGGRLALPVDLDGPFGDLADLPEGDAVTLRESEYGFHLLQRAP